MSQESQNAVAHGAEHSLRLHKTTLSRLVVWCGAALALFGTLAGCARRPAAPASQGEVLFGKMRAAIESVSRGIVRVEDQAPSDDGRSQRKRTFRLVFDDGQKMLRCDAEKLSQGTNGLRRQTKYARTPIETLFQLVEEQDIGGITIGPPDRDLSGSDDQPLEPYLLWFAGAGGYRSRERYSDIMRAWLASTREAEVSKDDVGRLALSWTKQGNIQRLVIDPSLGFVPVRNEVAVGSDKPTVISWTDIRYEKKNGYFVPVSLDIHEHGGRTIKVTCRWDSVNERIAPGVFTTFCICVLSPCESDAGCTNRLWDRCRVDCPKPTTCRRFRNDSRAVGLGKVCLNSKLPSCNVQPVLIHRLALVNAKCSFTVEGFEPPDGTPIFDCKGPKPVLRAIASRRDEFKKSITQAMGTNKPLDVRLQNSLADSRMFETYVLVFAASPSSEVSRRFFSILKSRDPQDGDDKAREALDNFTMLPIDAASRERSAAARTFLARWKLEPPSPDDAVLAVVDHDGRLVAATTSKQLWPDMMDGKALTAFLKKHLSPVPDAQTRLADALAQAKRENKRVLVEESGAGCGWCRVLARYLERHRSLIEKDYVWIVLDRRFAHGEAVMRKLRAISGGIPWMAILDSEGKPLITSDGPQRSLGYPGDIKDRPHFAKMWRSTAQRLSEDEINILLADVLMK